MPKFFRNALSNHQKNQDFLKNLRYSIFSLMNYHLRLMIFTSSKKYEYLFAQFELMLGQIDAVFRKYFPCMTFDFFVLSCYVVCKYLVYSQGSQRWPFLIRSSCYACDREMKRTIYTWFDFSLVFNENSFYCVV